MCLWTGKTLKRRRSGYGYKVFFRFKKSKTIEAEMFDRDYRINQWYLANPKEIQYMHKKGDYLAGFHIFLRLKDAKLWRLGHIRENLYEIRRVRYRGGRTIGTQRKFVPDKPDTVKAVFLPCIVADEIMPLRIISHK